VGVNLKDWLTDCQKLLFQESPEGLCLGMDTAISKLSDVVFHVK